MKAIVFTRYGSPDHMRLQDAPKPIPKANEVLIKVRASSINSWDWEFQSGQSLINRLLFGLLRPKAAKRIIGADVAGTVEAIGADVTRFQPGDAVFGDLWDNWGGFAEYACAPESSFEPIPANSTFEQTAAVPQAGVLALQALRKAGGVQPGQKILINGAGGGVGAFAVQIAKSLGAVVTGVDSAHKLEAVRALGADNVFDYAAEDFTRNGQHYDLIVDVKGNRSMFANRRALAPGGTYAMVGGTVPRIVQALLFGLCGALTGGRKFRIVADGPNKGLADLKALIEAGAIVPTIDKTFKLSETPKAMRYFTEGRHIGKIVIAMES